MLENSIDLPPQKRGVLCALLLLVALVMYGCGGRQVAPVYDQAGQPVYPEPIEEEAHIVPTAPKSAVGAGPAAPLYKKAQKLLSQRKYKQAEMAMERALRIEPKNGYYWYTLAKIAHSQNQPARTVQLCLKSKSHARGSARLIQLNDELIARSR